VTPTRRRVGRHRAAVELPAGAEVTGAVVEADGLHLTVELADVTLDSL
jgi:hypothetical protein